MNPHDPTQSEFDEISGMSDRADAKSRAEELFAHALLTAHADYARHGQAGQELRVRAVLDHLDDARRQKTDGAPAPVSIASKSRVKRFVGIAAAILVLGLAVAFWPDSRMTPAWADALVDRALNATSESTHVYDCEIVFERRGKTYTSRWEAALGTDRRFHAKVIDGGGFVPPGVEFGSNGKRLWARSRVGDAFELPMHDPAMLPWSGLGPELAYYELRPFLESSHGDLRLEVLEIERVGNSRRVVLGGPYEREETRSRHRYDRKTRSWKRKAKTIKIEGDMRVEVDERSGKLRRILSTRRSQTKSRRMPQPVRFDLVRRETELDAKSLGFDFDPPRVRTHPMHRLFSWFGALGRSGIEAVRRKREREAREKRQK